MLAGLTVLLVLETQKEDPFKRVLEAGSAAVFTSAEAAPDHIDVTLFSAIAADSRPDEMRQAFLRSNDVQVIDYIFTMLHEAARELR